MMRLLISKASSEPTNSYKHKKRAALAGSPFCVARMLAEKEIYRFPRIKRLIKIRIQAPPTAIKNPPNDQTLPEPIPA